MKIVVVGKGGREHAIITALVESPSAPEVYSYPGSDAIFELAKPVAGVTDVPSLIEFINQHKIDLCIAGEEAWLVKGLGDLCKANGTPCWGPVQASAQLEASKEFAKEFMIRHEIPTGTYASTSTLQEAREAITGYPTVLKFDGLAAGKGVAVCHTEEEAHAFLDEVFVAKRFGEGRVLVEEFLEGPEVSIFLGVSDGKYQIYTPARDYKRIRNNDEGPNTGGMGAVASRVLIGRDLLEEIENTMVKPTVEGMGKDGLDYKGFLYLGIMLTKDGPRMLEYNCRFGDPECQAVMPLIQGDVAEYIYHAARGELRPEMLTFTENWSVCLILASAGYPESSRSGDVISGLDQVEGVRVYHAGTRRNGEGEFETNGGRVLAVVAQGADREKALNTVYRESAKVNFDGCQRRSDVGILHF